MYSKKNPLKFSKNYANSLLILAIDKLNKNRFKKVKLKRHFKIEKLNSRSSIKNQMIFQIKIASNSFAEETPYFYKYIQLLCL